MNGSGHRVFDLQELSTFALLTQLVYALGTCTLNSIIFLLSPWFLFRQVLLVIMLQFLYESGGSVLRKCFMWKLSQTETGNRIIQLEANMRRAESYSEWRDHNRALDNLDNHVNRTDALDIEEKAVVDRLNLHSQR